MADLNAGQRDELTFIAGIDENGTIANNTYFTYNVEGFNFDPPRSYISKWYNDAGGSPIASTSKAGTPAGVVTYAFDSTVGVRAQASYNASLTLWSNIANIQFKEVSTPSTASILISDTPTTNGDTYTPANGSRVPGTGVTDLPTQMSPNARGGQIKVNIGGGDSSYNNFGPGGAYSVGTVTHELGHAIGLGHAGRYNGANEPGGQIGVYDTLSWSIMSYIHPEDTNAPYYDQYPIQNSQWTAYTSTGQINMTAQTPMMLDILAAQRLYGASTSQTFAGGQTYGFNSNIADVSGQFYDFSKNQTPVVTIYNTGSNNTLDVSGFGNGSSINLNPGTFSSADVTGQLMNNIGIAYGTRIDKAIGGAGNDRFILNNNGNTIDGGGGFNAAILQGKSSDYIVTKTGTASATVRNATTGVTDTLINVQSIQFEAPVCFTTGSRIRTLHGGIVVDVPVEDLRVGDVAITASGAHSPITWIGHRHLSGETPLPADLAPVRIRAGAFGRDAPGSPVPVRDLRLSPGHPVLVGADLDGAGGVLVPVMCLINGTTIAREPVAQVTYWHVELDAHDILLAEGLPAESFLDFGCRAFFAEASDHALHNPDFVPPGLSGRCRPVVTDGPLVQAERNRLDAVFATGLTAHCAWSGLDAFA